MSEAVEKVLAECLDRIDGGEATIEEALRLHPELGAELKPLLRLSAELGSMPKVSAPASLRGFKRPVFVSRPAPSPWWHRLGPALPTVGWAAPMARVAAAFAALLLLGGGSIVASANSLPDEPLYSVKLAVESAQLALAANPEDRSDLEMTLAAKRLGEAETAAEQGRPQAVQRALGLYEKQVQGAIQSVQETPGVKDQQNQKIDGTLDQQQEVLTRVLSQAPEQARPAIQHAIDASSKHLDQRKKAQQPATPAVQQEASVTPRPAATAVATGTPEAPNSHEPPVKAKLGPGSSSAPGQEKGGKPETGVQSRVADTGVGQGSAQSAAATGTAGTAGPTPPPASGLQSDLGRMEGGESARGGNRAAGGYANGEARQKAEKKQDALSDLVQSIQKWIRPQR